MSFLHFLSFLHFCHFAFLLLFFFLSFCLICLLSCLSFYLVQSFDQRNTAFISIVIKQLMWLPPRQGFVGFGWLNQEASQSICHKASQSLGSVKHPSSALLLYPHDGRGEAPPPYHQTTHPVYFFVKIKERNEEDFGTLFISNFPMSQIGLAMRRFLLMRIDAAQMRIDAH